MPSSSVGIPNIAGSGAGWLAKSAGNGPSWLTMAMKWAMPAPKPLRWYVSWIARAAAGVLAIRQRRTQRRLVRDQRPHVLGMLRDERQRVDRAAAAGEQVDRSATDAWMTRCRSSA